MPRLLSLASLLVLGLAGVYAQVPQIDCNQPADVELSVEAPANLRFQGSAGELVYIRITGLRVDPGFFLGTPVLDLFGNRYNPRPSGGTTADATASDMAGLFNGQSFRGFEFDL